MNKTEITEHFNQRKKDHIKWSLNSRSQVDQPISSFLKLVHDPLPDLNFEEVQLSSSSAYFGDCKPLLVSSMTAGHQEAFEINKALIAAAKKKNWIFATGSLRKELDAYRRKEESADLNFWKEALKDPELCALGNIGLAQLISEENRAALVAFMEELPFRGLFIHLNPLQEALQPEGTPQFKNWKAALKDLTAKITKPVFLKETGSGFSAGAFKKLEGLNIKAVDVAGKGGTHWGRVESLRAPEKSFSAQAMESFKDWGEWTHQSLQEAQNHSFCEIWASGGMRNGVDAAVSYALGASVVGFAQPLMQAALEGEKSVVQFMDQIEYELKVALFCTDSASIADLQAKEEVLQWV